MTCERLFRKPHRGRASEQSWGTRRVGSQAWGRETGSVRNAGATDDVPALLPRLEALNRELLQQMMQANIELERAIERGDWAGPICARARALVTGANFAADCKRIVFGARHIPYDTALALLAALGFLASSERRHAAIAPFDSHLPGHVASALRELGERTGHEPRDAADTAWLPNPNFGWTCSTSELQLGVTVRNIEHQFVEIIDRLAPMARARRTLMDARSDLLAVERALAELFASRELPTPGQDLAFRRYLAPIEIGSSVYPGPNPTRTPGWAAMDSLMGRRGALPRYAHSLRDVLREMRGRQRTHDPDVELARSVMLAVHELEQRLSLEGGEESFDLPE